MCVLVPRPHHHRMVGTALWRCVVLCESRCVGDAAADGRREGVVEAAAAVVSAKRGQPPGRTYRSGGVVCAGAAGAAMWTKMAPGVAMLTSPGMPFDGLKFDTSPQWPTAVDGAHAAAAKADKAAAAAKAASASISGVSIWARAAIHPSRSCHAAAPTGLR